MDLLFFSTNPPKKGIYADQEEVRLYGLYAGLCLDHPLRWALAHLGVCKGNAQALILRPHSRRTQLKEMLDRYLEYKESQQTRRQMHEMKKIRLLLRFLYILLALLMIMSLVQISIH